MNEEICRVIKFAEKLGLDFNKEIIETMLMLLKVGMSPETMISLLLEIKRSLAIADPGKKFYENC